MVSRVCLSASYLAWQIIQRLKVAANFSTICFILAMHIGTIDFYHFIPLSLTLTLPEGHKVSVEQNFLASNSGTLFN